jgi:3-isopropylmalate dehydrogenase
MGSYQLLIAAGDGIGPEIMDQARLVLEAVSRRFGHRFECHEELVGGAAIAAHGAALAPGALERAAAADAVLFGAVGDPRYDDPRAAVRPEQAILDLRRGLGLFANLRPVSLFAALVDASPLKAEVVRGADFVVIRELTGGLYFGEPRERVVAAAGRRAVDTLAYDEHEIARILHVAFRRARSRSGRLASVDKANVLESSRLWREVAEEIAPGYPDVTLEHVLVDACAMHLVTNPRRFDVIVTENMFGDILTDEAATLAGSLGMLPSASLGASANTERPRGLYEPIHGSAPDIAGQGVANPIGMIRSTAMMLDISLGLTAEAAAVEAAVATVLDAGLRTADIAADPAAACSTAELGAAVVEQIGTAFRNG